MSARVFEEAWRDAPPDPEPWRWSWRAGLLSAALAGLPAGARWLDLGCGAGRFLTLGEGGIGVDVAPSALGRARAVAPGAELRLLDDPDGTLPLAHGEVELVWCSETIEHVADALGLLQEVRRVLAEGGRLVLTTPAHPRWRRTAIALARFEQHFDPLGQHVRYFTAGSLRRALGAAGLAPGAVATRHATLVARAGR